LIDFFNIDNDFILNNLYTSRHTSAKVYLFSERLAEIIPLFADMNINMQYGGLIAFDKDKKNLDSKVNTKFRILISNY
jgi:hypothetical protein